MKLAKKKLLVFYPAIAPYRLDLFNRYASAFDAVICFDSKYLPGNAFKHDTLFDKLAFTPVYQSDSYREKSAWQKLRFAWQMYRKVKPEVVQVMECGLVPLFFVILKRVFRQKFRLVSMIDDSYDMAVLGRTFSRRHKWAEKLLVRYFDDVIVVDPRVRDYFQKKYHRGTFFPIIQDEKRVKADLLQSLPLASQLVGDYALEGKRVLLFVGRLVEVKNVPSSIQAFLSVATADDRYVVIGDGEEMEQCKAAANGDSRVVMTGRREGIELMAWYALAGALILPSTIEAFGAVVNEAMLAGCKAVVSARCGAACLVEEGTNGYIFDPLSEKEMAQSIARVLNGVQPVGKRIVERESTMHYHYDELFDKVLETLNS